MRVLSTALLLVLMALTGAGADEVAFFDNFNDGNIDGWVTFGYEATHSIWCQGSELWGRASSGSDCCHCPSCGAVAVVDDLICTDFTVELKITNHNNCGGFGLLLRIEEETWASGEDLAYLDHWLVYFDPGYSSGYWSMGARVDGIYMDPGVAEGTLSFGIGVAHYFRVVLHGQSMELWHRADGAPGYSHIHTLNVSGGATEGYIGLAISQSAKHASFDDVIVYSHETPVEQSTWGNVKALYR